MMTKLGSPALLALMSMALLGAGCSGGSGSDDKAVPPPDGGVPKALDVTWAVRDDASSVQMAAFAQRIQQSSNALWAATHGQLFLRNVNLVDKTAAGEIVLDNLTLRSADLAFAYTYLLTGGAWEIHLGGNFPMQAFIHEMGHGEVLQDWLLAEEYDLPGSPCVVCAMDAYLIGSGEGSIIYCDANNCTTTRNGCWPAVILQTHPDWAYPRIAGMAPTVNITVQDN